MIPISEQMVKNALRSAGLGDDQAARMRIALEAAFDDPEELAGYAQAMSEAAESDDLLVPGMAMMMLADLRRLGELVQEWPEDETRERARQGIAQGIAFLTTPKAVFVAPSEQPQPEAGR